ncbi:hypothetical protein J6590_060302 [Homalodisca vitripennis]|nr:hypothetical protein J6590_060302 [Homalodisca vitripennis]
MASYGSVDVKAHTVSSALIAVSSRQSARDIVKAYVADKEYRVVPYSYLRHSSLLRYIRLPRNGSPQTEAKSRHEGQSHVLPPLRRANEVQTVTYAFRNKYSTLP